MLSQFSRTELLIGNDAIKKLQNAKVAVFGIGGVGSFVVEGLARTGVGNFLLVDNDTVSLTNLNRQLIATHQTLGNFKVDVAKETQMLRFLKIFLCLILRIFLMIQLIILLML